MTFAERLENSYWLNALFGLFPLIYLGANFSKIGFDLNLNLVILIFLTLGLYLHSSPNGFLKAVAQESVPAAVLFCNFRFMLVCRG